MLNLFGKIRKELLENSRVGKYLAYALGEIILVVVGILIALQVNNYNQHNIEKKKEKLYLKEFIEDIETDKEELLRVIKKTNRIMIYADSLLVYSRSKSIPFDDIDIVNLFLGSTGFTVYMAREATVNDIIGSGNLNLIRSSSIRSALASWITDMKYIREWEKIYKDKANRYELYLEQKLDFSRLRFNEPFIDASTLYALLQDLSLRNYLDNSSWHSDNLNDLYKERIAYLDRQLDSINKYLDR